MKMILLLMLVPAFAYAFECEDQRDITTEKDEKVVFCTSENLQLSKKCAENLKSCKLVLDLASRPEESKLKEALKITAVGTSGSRLCNLKGWTVLMGEMFDKSQVCTCKHPSGEFITCVSLDRYYRKE